MKNTLRTALVAGILLLGLLIPGVAIAQDEPAPPSAPRAPLTYTDSWNPIEPGAWHWYAFKYREAENNRPMLIRLYTRPHNGIELLLLNGEQVRVWQQGGKLEGFGAATPAYTLVEEQVSQEELCKAKPDADECQDGDLDSNSTKVNPDDCAANNGSDANDDNCFLLDVPEPLGYGQWAGKIGASGEYYILVRRAASSEGPGAYRIAVSGDGFTFR